MVFVERAPLTVCGLASAVRVEILSEPVGVAVTAIALELAMPEYFCEWMFTRLPCYYNHYKYVFDIEEDGAYARAP